MEFGQHLLKKKGYRDEPWITIHNARVCLEPNCEVIFSGDICPRCLSTGYKISEKIPPLSPRTDPEENKRLRKEI
jgi:hypothetical protein